MGDLSALSTAYNDQTPPPTIINLESGAGLTRDAGLALKEHLLSLDDPRALDAASWYFARAAKAADNKLLRSELGEEFLALENALATDTLAYKHGYPFDPAVGDVQTTLQKLGHNHVKKDDILGPDTTEAILYEAGRNPENGKTLSLEDLRTLNFHLQRSNSTAHSNYQSGVLRDLRQQIRDAEDTVRSIEQKGAQIVTRAIHACTELKLMVGDDFVRDIVEAYDGTDNTAERFDAVVGVLDKHCALLSSNISDEAMAKLIGTLDTYLEEPMKAMRGILAAEEREKLLDSDPRIRDALKEYEMRRFNL